MSTQLDLCAPLRDPLAERSDLTGSGPVYAPPIVGHLAAALLLIPLLTGVELQRAFLYR
jgi:hypothetical protein